MEKEIQDKIDELKAEEIQAAPSATAEKSDYKDDFSTTNFSKDLGMSNVPVLDQGIDGTCATFSTTAAIDAKKSSGDYISQQCLLELGVNQQSKGMGNSGWSGAWPTSILNRMKTYGVIDKPSCPHTYGNKELSMNEDDYINYSGKVWSKDIMYKTLKKDNLAQLKSAIDNNHRLIISTLLHKKQVSGFPINGKRSGLWKLPDANKLQEFKDDIFKKRKRGAHAVVVTGYDDAKKLIKIRNSWSKYAGDNGEYYMTYDFYNFNESADTGDILII